MQRTYCLGGGFVAEAAAETSAHPAWYCCLQYMAPEILLGRKITPAVDVYRHAALTSVLLLSFHCTCWRGHAAAAAAGLLLTPCSPHTLCPLPHARLQLWGPAVGDLFM